MRGRRSDDRVILDPELGGLRSDRGRCDRASVHRRRRRDATAAAVHARVRGLIVGRSAATNTRRCGHVVRGSCVVVTRGRTGDDVMVHVLVIEMRVRAVRVVVVVAIPAERPTDRVAVVPVPRRRSGRPTDVAVAGRSGAPRDPRTRVATTGDPRPTVARKIDPTTVVERSPTPIVVGDPDVARLVRIRPMAGGHVRLEVRADLFLRRNPNRSVRRVLDPCAVTFERGLELGQRARIGVGVFVGVRSDRDLALRLCLRLLTRGELLARERRWWRVITLRVLGLVSRRWTAPDRKHAEDGERNEARDARDRRHCCSSPTLDHSNPDLSGPSSNFRSEREPATIVGISHDLRIPCESSPTGRRGKARLGFRQSGRGGLRVACRIRHDCEASVTRIGLGRALARGQRQYVEPPSQTR